MTKHKHKQLVFTIATYLNLSGIFLLGNRIHATLRIPNPEISFTQKANTTNDHGAGTRFLLSLLDVFTSFACIIHDQANELKSFASVDWGNHNF